MLALLHPVTSPHPHLQCEGGEEPVGLPSSPAAGPGGGQPFSSPRTPPWSCAMLQAGQQRQQAEAVGCLPSLAAMPSLLGFLQRGTRRKYYYCFVFAPYRRAIQGATMYPYQGEIPLSCPMAISSNAVDVQGCPATLAPPLQLFLSFLLHDSAQHECCRSSRVSFPLLHRHRPASQPFQTTTSILPPLTAISKAFS